MHFFKEGYIGAANGATLFLDEIDELPLHLQIKLLGAIENKIYPPRWAAIPPRNRSFAL